MIKTSECFVVLGHLMEKNGHLKYESKLRVEHLVKILKKNLQQPYIFFCGWDYRKDSSIKIAEAMSFYFKKKNKIHRKIILSELSRDTVGDAILLCKNYSHLIKDRKINVITSNYHAERTSKIFKFIFPDNLIEVHEAKVIYQEGDIARKESDSLNAFYETFKGLKEGDIENIYIRLVSKHPYYDGTVYKKLG